MIAKRRSLIPGMAACLLPMLVMANVPEPSKTGNQYLDYSTSSCAGSASYGSCVTSTVSGLTNIIDGPLKQFSDSVVSISTDPNKPLPFNPLRDTFDTWMTRRLNSFTKHVGEFTAAYLLTQGNYSSPGGQDIAQSSGQGGGWESSRSTCCGSRPQEFKETTEALQPFLKDSVEEVRQLSSNITVLAQMRQAYAVQKNVRNEQSIAPRLHSLAEIRKRVSLARTMIANHVAYAGDPKLGEDVMCSATADNMIANLPFAVKWTGGTHEINTIQLTQRPMINPNLLDGKRERPKDAFERWLLANPQFQPDNLWSIFQIPHIGFFDGWTLELARFGTYGDKAPESAGIDPDLNDSAPLVRGEQPAKQGLTNQNLAYEPTAHAVNLMVNMLLDAESVPPTLNPSIRGRNGRNKIFFIFSNVPTYTGNEAGSGTTIGYKPWRDWAKQQKADNPFEENFQAEMAIREIHAAMLKSVFTSYMMEHYRLFQAPEGKTAAEVVFTGFADAFLPISEQNNSKVFKNFNIQTDKTTNDWAERLGLKVQGAYTEAQRRDMTISLLTHPYMQEVVTRTHGDDLRRLDVKYLNTLAYLRKKRIDELNKQRLLLIIIAEQRDHLEKASEAAHHAARVIP